MIVIGWPPKEVRGNTRSHWRPKATATRRYRTEAQMATMLANPKRPLPFVGERLPIKVTFHPPNNRHWDDDNLVTGFKAARDGIADALGVNDRCFAAQYVFAGPIKGGIVTVELGS